MSAPRKAKRKRVKLVIELEIECDERQDAYDVLESLLDAGSIQDLFNEHVVADAESLRVLSAVGGIGRKA